MKYLLFVIFMAIQFIAHAQKFKFGFRTGVSFSNFYLHHSPGEVPSAEITSDPSGPVFDPSAPSYYYETDFIQDARVGMFSYVNMSYQIKPRFSSEIGLGYTQRGINIAYDLHSTSVNSGNSTKLFYEFRRNLRLDYISIPLTFQYSIDKKERLHLIAGIYNSVAVSFQNKESVVITKREILDSSGNTLVVSESRSSTTDAYASLFDSGVICGIGLNFPLVKGMSVGLDIRSAIGLINIPQKYEEYGFQSFSRTSKNISFETGLKLQYALK